MGWWRGTLIKTRSGHRRTLRNVEQKVSAERREATIVEGCGDVPGIHQVFSTFVKYQRVGYRQHVTGYR